MYNKKLEEEYLKLIEENKKLKSENNAMLEILSKNYSKLDIIKYCKLSCRCLFDAYFGRRGFSY